LEGISDGETVTVPEGEYHLRSTANVEADGVTVDGNGARIVVHGHR
jgi:hypothetical protein